MSTPSKNVPALAWLRLAGLALVLAVIGVTTIVSGASSLRDAVDDVATAGWSGVAAFVLLYALATVLLVPGSASTVTAGIVYGTVGGAAVAVAGATLGATAAYGFARGAGRRPTQALLASRAAEIDTWVAQRQFRSIVVSRLLPVVPFNLFNYVAGLSPVRPTAYVTGTAIGLVPGALLVAGLGSSAHQPTSVAFVGSLVVVGVAIVGSAVLTRRWARR
ncbi:MAG: TVP38/TMEM64 family protein [Acidimicrobiales bacterium]